MKRSVHPFTQMQAEMSDWRRRYHENLPAWQEATLKAIAGYLAPAAWGKKHGLGEIASIEDFRRRTPIQEYSDLQPFIQRMLDGETDVLFPGSVTDWIQSSGTTGKRKLFPYNNTFERNWFDCVPLATSNYVTQRGPRALMKIGSGACLLTHGCGYCGMEGKGANQATLGFNSGWNARKRSLPIPVLPSDETQKIENWDIRFLETAAECASSSLSMLSGVTTYNLMFLREMQTAFAGRMLPALARRDPARAKALSAELDRRGTIDLAALWPNLGLCYFTGVSPHRYQAELATLLPTTDLIQAYIGSEGFYGFQADPDGEAMFLSPDSGFYEFIPVDDYRHWQTEGGKQPQRLSAWETMAGQAYVLAVTTFGGLCAYLPGDIVVVEDTNPFRFRHGGRTGRETNLAAEKLDVPLVADAVAQAETATTSLVREYCMVAQAGKLPRYVLTVEFATSPAQPEAFAAAIERALFDANPLYAEVRNMGVLKPLVLRIVPGGAFALLISKLAAKGDFTPGQSKLPELTEDSRYVGLLPTTREVFAP